MLIWQMKNLRFGRVGKRMIPLRGIKKWVSLKKREFADLKEIIVSSILKKVIHSRNNLKNIQKMRNMKKKLLVWLMMIRNKQYNLWVVMILILKFMKLQQRQMFLITLVFCSKISKMILIKKRKFKWII